MPYTYKPIGVIHSPFKEIAEMPIQPSGAIGIRGSIEIYPEYMAGLKDLDGFSHLILLYHFHRCDVTSLEVTPFLDQQPHGVFATRAPCRPNPIGLSIVKLVCVVDASLAIANVDVLDGTPLLDIKPYVPDFDRQKRCRVGWLQNASRRVSKVFSDHRFSE